MIQKACGARAASFFSTEPLLNTLYQYSDIKDERKESEKAPHHISLSEPEPHQTEGALQHWF
jgi:hypothetical protein